MGIVQFFAAARSAASRRKLLEQAANKQLVESGLFKTVAGPEGGIPIQVNGTLKTGQRFYFRERFGMTEVELNGRVVSKESAQSNMTPDQAATYVLNFLRTR